MRIRILISTGLPAIFASLGASHQAVDVVTAQITSAPNNFARQQANAIQTCGYVSGEANSPLTCGGTYSCTIDGAGNNFFACCDSFNSCTSDWHTCANWGEPTLGAICSEIYTSCLNCGADQPFCATYKRYISMGAASPFTSLFCATAATTITAVVHANQAPPLTGTGSFTGTSLATGSTNAATSTSTGTPTPGKTSSEKLSGGAIAGITVGAIIISIAILAIGYFVFVSSRRVPEPRPPVEMLDPNFPENVSMDSRSTNPVAASPAPSYYSGTRSEARRQSVLSGSSTGLRPPRVQ